MHTIKIKLTHQNTKIPWQGTKGSAGYDISSVEKVTIPPKQSHMIKTGLAVEIPAGHFLMIAPRSSLSIKKHLYQPNSIGIIDSDYRGEILVALYNNHSSETAIIEENERIAQMLLIEFKAMQFDEVDELSDTDRGEGNFGSTGKI